MTSKHSASRSSSNYSVNESVLENSTKGRSRVPLEQITKTDSWKRANENLLDNKTEAFKRRKCEETVEHKIRRLRKEREAYMTERDQLKEEVQHLKMENVDLNQTVTKLMQQLSEYQDLMNTNAHLVKTEVKKEVMESELKFLACPEFKSFENPLGTEYKFLIGQEEYSIIIEDRTGDLLTSTPPYSTGRYIALMQFSEPVRCTSNCYGWESLPGRLHLGFCENDEVLTTLSNRIRSISAPGGDPDRDPNGSDTTHGCGGTRRDLWGHGNDIVVHSAKKLVPSGNSNGAEACDRLGRLFLRGRQYDTNLDLHDPKIFDVVAAQFILVCFAIHDYHLDIPFNDPCVEYDSEALTTEQYWINKVQVFENRRTDLLKSISDVKKCQSTTTNIFDSEIPIVRDGKIITSTLTLLKDLQRKLKFVTFVKGWAMLKLCEMSQVPVVTLNIILKGNKREIGRMTKGLQKLQKWTEGYDWPSPEKMDFKIAKKKKNKESKKIHVCEICQKIFSHPHYVTVHKKGHTDAHKCTTCGHRCRTTYELKRHMLKHTGEKPFHCSCGKGFV